MTTTTNDSYHDHDGDEDDEGEDCCYDGSYDGGDGGGAPTLTTMTTRMRVQVIVCARPRVCVCAHSCRNMLIVASMVSVVSGVCTVFVVVRLVVHCNCCNPTQKHKIHKSILRLYRVASCMRQADSSNLLFRVTWCLWCRGCLGRLLHARQATQGLTSADGPSFCRGSLPRHPLETQYPCCIRLFRTTTSYSLPLH